MSAPANPAPASPWRASANNNTGSEASAIPPAASHPAVLVAMVDLGVHEKTFDKTNKDGQKTGEKETRNYRQLFLAWELTDEPDPDHKGRNFVLGKEFSLAEDGGMGLKSALRGVVEIWLGRKLGDREDVPDVSKMLGMRCMLEVVHGQNAEKTRTYANVKAVTSVPKKLAVPDPKCKPYLYALSRETFPGGFAPPPWLPQWSYGEKLTDKMQRSKEVRGGAAARDTEAQAAEAFGFGANDPNAEDPRY
jgi:hypothetical protein